MNRSDRLAELAARHGLSDAAQAELTALFDELLLVTSLDSSFVLPLSDEQVRAAPRRATISYEGIRPDRGATFTSDHGFGRPAGDTVNVTALEQASSVPAPSRVAGPAASSAADNRLHRSSAAADDSPELPSRFEDLGLLGVGGMGEVRRVRDRVLNRVVAMKIIQPRVLETRLGRARFLAEAQATAQLQHPGVVPVHDAGQLRDGRDYYVMQQVIGRTLDEVIREVHAVSGPRGYGVSQTGWSFRRLVQAFHAACEAMAYAHARGVIHRDLKPQNVLVGAYGEVFVVDWGLMKIVGSGGPTAEEAEAELGEVLSPADDGLPRTLAGRVTGTPAYMSPEQALGQVGKMGPPSDVFSLGLVLYEILWGFSPYCEGADRFRSLLPQIQGVEKLLFPDDERQTRPPVPDVLERICRECLQADPDARFPDAGALAAEMGGFLLGARNREQALAVLEEADRLSVTVTSLERRARRARDEAAQRLEAVAFDAPASAKREVWQLEDEARRLQVDAEVKQAQWLELVRSALTHDPGLADAHHRLADHHRERLMRAECDDDLAAAAPALWLLRAHAAGRHARFLKGRGAITLHTDPPGAEVILHRMEERDRKLVAVEVGSLGRTPLDAVEVERGSYLLVVLAEGFLPLRVPVRLHREEHWDGIPPGARETLPVRLQRPEDLAPGERYVPGGWFDAGAVEGPAMRALLPRRVWVDGFVIQRHPVTLGAFARTLDLVHERDAELAARWLPTGPGGPLLYREGTSFIADQPELPVTWISWDTAMAYADWLSSRSTLPWRLPGELEWEKAARGVDGRAYPWGNHLDPMFAAHRASFRGQHAMQPVDAFADDESVYGVRGMAGNVSDWCLDAWRVDGPLVQDDVVCPRLPERHDGQLRAIRGGQHGGRDLRVAVRRQAMRDARLPTVSFRLLRPV